MAKKEDERIEGSFQIANGEVILSDLAREQLSTAPPEIREKLSQMMDAMKEAQKRMLAGEFPDPQSAIKAVFKERNIEGEFTMINEGDEIPDEVLEALDDPRAHRSTLN